MLIPIYWSVQCILMDLNGEFAQTLFQRSYGNLTIPKVTIQKWNRNVAGIQFLQVNALNAAPHFHGCDYPHSNGAVNVVVGKMISKPSLPRLLLDYSLRSTPYTSRPLTLLIVSSIAAEAAMISRSSPPRYKRPKLPTATISKILIEAAFSASLAAKAA